jgi:hypothetical protein
MLSPDECARLVDVLLASLRETPLAEIGAAWEREVEERPPPIRPRGGSNTRGLKRCLPKSSALPGDAGTVRCSSLPRGRSPFQKWRAKE